MRVLLTGASGFVGRQCVRALATRGFEVFGVSSKPAVDAAIAWRQADLLDPAAVQRVMADVRPSHLLHLAWVATPGVYWTSLDNASWLAASVGLLQAFHQHGGRRVVMAGSCAEYDWSGDICSESRTPLHPTTLYGSSKYALQQVVQAYCRQAALSEAWGRIFFTFGPHEHPARLVPSVAGRLILGRPAPCSHGAQVRDFLAVEDVADAFAALVASDVAGPVNIASGEGVSIRSLVIQIARQLDAEALLQLGARPSAPREPPSIVADVSRLRTEVGWVPGRDTAARLSHTIEWWREELSAGRIDAKVFA